MICEHRTWAASPECPNRNGHCGTLQPAYVYGLYDPRIDDMFYIGSTIWPARRYSDHVHASAPGNFREAWILSILAAGSQPLFCSLSEFRTACELEIKATERAIAQEWRALGHTALCDGGTNMMHSRIPITDLAPNGSEAHWILIEQAIAEHLDRVNEQARILQWLRDF